MRKVGFLLLTLVVALILPIMIAGCSAQLRTLSAEEIAQDIYRSLMCPLCAGQTIEQSQSELSTQMRATVREKIEQGWTKDEILQFFVERYGEVVLAVPGKSGFNLAIWLAPITALIIGGIVTWLAIRQWTRRGKEPSSESAAPAPKSASDETYRRRLEQELKNFDNKRGYR